MNLVLMPKQQGKFDNLQKLIDGDLLEFVQKSPSVSTAMEKWGTFQAVESWVPDAKRQQALNAAPDKSKRFRLLWRALLPGTMPQVVVMSKSAMLTSSDVYAAYNSQGPTIVVCRGLIEGFEQDPDHEVLLRNTITVLLHELVHYLNDQVLPGTDIYAGDTPHLEQFAREAFDPLGWKKYHYTLTEDILQELGAKCQ